APAVAAARPAPATAPAAPTRAAAPAAPAAATAAPDPRARRVGGEFPQERRDRVGPYLLRRIASPPASWLYEPERPFGRGE
ncbi:MAG TPA: hypothetical protein DIT60_03030, partial [Alcanivorax sp.]|nr:hypothetical protein [Alcanivorax sp.]